jgi:arylformamidase
MKWIDLSLPVWTGMPVYPGDSEVAITPFATYEKDGFMGSSLSMSCHAGTHIDAPRHFIWEGPGIDNLSLDQLSGPALVIACPYKPGRMLDVAAMNYSNLRPGDALLLATGWDERASTSAYYDQIPVFAPGSSAFLLSLGIRLFGLDLPTVREAAAPGQPFSHSAMHMELLGSGIVIVESLANLMPLSGKRIEFQAFPLRLLNCEGSPTRACARLSD